MQSSDTALSRFCRDRRPGPPSPIIRFDSPRALLVLFYPPSHPSLSCLPSSSPYPLVHPGSAISSPLTRTLIPFRSTAISLPSSGSSPPNSRVPAAAGCTRARPACRGVSRLSMPRVFRHGGCKGRCHQRRRLTGSMQAGSTLVLRRRRKGVASESAEISRRGQPLLFSSLDLYTQPLAILRQLALKHAHKQARMEGAASKFVGLRALITFLSLAQARVGMPSCQRPTCRRQGGGRCFLAWPHPGPPPPPLPDPVERHPRKISPRIIRRASGGLRRRHHRVDRRQAEPWRG